MDLQATYQRRAQHEVLHAGFGVHAGFELERVTVHPRGATVLFWPVSQRDLWKEVRRNPLKALAAIKDIASVLTAPEVVLDVRTIGPDQVALQSWQQAWEVARQFARPEAPPWSDVLKSARWQIITWHGEVGRKPQLDKLSELLLEHGTLTGDAFTSLYRRLDRSLTPKRSPYAVALV